MIPGTKFRCFMLDLVIFRFIGALMMVPVSFSILPMRTTNPEGHLRYSGQRGLLAPEANLYRVVYQTVSPIKPIAIP